MAAQRESCAETADFINNGFPQSRESLLYVLFNTLGMAPEGDVDLVPDLLLRLGGKQKGLTRDTCRAKWDIFRELLRERAEQAADSSQLPIPEGFQNTMAGLLEQGGYMKQLKPVRNYDNHLTATQQLAQGGSALLAMLLWLVPEVEREKLLAKILIVLPENVGMPTIPKEGGNIFDEFPHLIFYTLKEWHQSHRPPPGKGANMDLLHSAPRALAPLATTAGATKRPAGAPPSVFPSTKKPLIATTQEPPSAFVPIPRHGGMTAPSTAPVAPLGGPPVEAVGAIIPQRQQLPVDPLPFASPQFGGGKVPGVATTPVLAGGGAGLLTPDLGVKPREGALVQQKAGGELLSAAFARSKDPGEGSRSHENIIEADKAHSEKVAAASAVLKAQRDAQAQSQRCVETGTGGVDAAEIQKVKRIFGDLSRFRSNRPPDVFKSRVEITYTKEVVETPFEDPIFKQSKYTVLGGGSTASDRVQKDITFPAKVEGETVPEFIEIGYLDVVAPASVDLTDEEVQKDGTYLSLVTEGRNIYPYYYTPRFGAANEATLYKNSGVYYTTVPVNIWLLQWDQSKEVYVQGRQIRLNGPTVAGPFMPQAALKRVLLPLALRGLVIGLLPQFLPDKGRGLAISFGKPFNFLENLATVCGEAAIISDIGERLLPQHITMHQAAICGKKVQEAVLCLVSQPLSTGLKVLGANIAKAGPIGAPQFGDTIAKFCKVLGDWARWIVEEVANPEWALASRLQLVDNLHIDVGPIEYRPAAGTPHPGTPHDRKNLPHRAELFNSIRKAIAKEVIVLSPEDPTGMHLAVCSIANGYDWPDTLLDLCNRTVLRSEF